MAISEETKYALSKFVDVLTMGLYAIPVPGCVTAAQLFQKFVTPEMIMQAAEAVGIREIIIVRGQEGSTFTGIIDQRTKP